MKTLGEILLLSSDFLAQKGIDRPRRQVEELLAHILELPRIELYLQFDRLLESDELEKLRSAIKLRAQGMPWQYIVGKVDFFGCAIQLSQDVLIPRQETEILADMIYKELPQAAVEIWDLCCGSGCLGIALKKKRPDCRVILSDISSKAVEMARQNATINGVEVECLQGDLMVSFGDRKADIVVCNPPYIAESAYSSLEREVRDWEPKNALVGGSTGYEFYERLAKELPPHLNPDATVYLEIGTGMGEKVKNLFTSFGWNSVEIRQDWASHDRFIRLNYTLQPL